MNNFKIGLAALALVSANSIAGECSIPDIPELPDGGSATMEQMLEGQKSIKAFQTANLEYMSCLDPLIAAAAETANADTASDEDKAAVKQLEEKYNTAVSVEEDLAGQFNTEIREYKAANPG